MKIGAGNICFETDAYYEIIQAGSSHGRSGLAIAFPFPATFAGVGKYPTGAVLGYGRLGQKGLDRAIHVLEFWKGHY